SVWHAALAHVSDHREKGHIHRKQNCHYKAAHEDQNHRLNKGRYRVEPYVDLGIVKVGHLIEHFAQRARAFAHADHIDCELRYPAGSFEAVGEWSSLADPRE